VLKLTPHCEERHNCVAISERNFILPHLFRKSDKLKLNMDDKAFYKFHEVPVNWSIQTSTNLSDLFHKWNILPGLILKKFTVEPRFLRESEYEAIIQCFFKDHIIADVLGCTSVSSNKNLTIKRLNCNATSMSFFKPLYGSGMFVLAR